MAKKKFEILERTAEIKVRCFGQTLEELFASAVKGLAAVVTGSEKFEFEQGLVCKKSVTVSDDDLERLFVEFLNEVNYYMEIDKVVYFEVDIKKLTDSQVEAELTGYQIPIRLEIKAVTYNDLVIKQLKDGSWLAEYVVDI